MDFLIRTLEGHAGAVFTVSFSPDGKYIASGGDNIKIWKAFTSANDPADKPDGSLIRTLEGHSGGVSSLMVSLGGKYVVSRGNNRTIKIWNISDGSLIKERQCGLKMANSIAYSPDGKYMASGFCDDIIKIWNASDDSLIQTLEGHSNWINSVSFSRDGKYIASGSIDNTIKIWKVSAAANAPADKPDGPLIRTLWGHTASVNSVSFSHDGKYIASGSADKTVKIWHSRRDCTSPGS